MIRFELKENSVRRKQQAQGITIVTYSALAIAKPLSTPRSVSYRVIEATKARCKYFHTKDGNSRSLVRSRLHKIHSCSAPK